MRTAFWRFVVCEKYVGCRFCGIFCALVVVVLLLWGCEACSTAESCKHVHEKPCSQSELEIENCGALAVGTESEAPALEHGRIVSCHSPVAQIKKRGAPVQLHSPAFFFASCKPAG